MTTLPTIAIRWEHDRLIATAAGDADITWVVAMVDQIGDAAASGPARSVLIEAVGIRVLLSDLDRYTMGTQIGRRWRGVPYALVAAPGVLDPRRFGELVAQNRGANARVFVDVAEALAWLDSQHPPRAP